MSTLEFIYEGWPGRTARGALLVATPMSSLVGQIGGVSISLHRLASFNRPWRGIKIDTACQRCQYAGHRHRAVLLTPLLVRFTNDERGEEEKKIAEKRNDTQDEGRHQAICLAGKRGQNGN